VQTHMLVVMALTEAHLTSDRHSGCMGHIVCAKHNRPIGLVSQPDHCKHSAMHAAQRGGGGVDCCPQSSRQRPRLAIKGAGVQSYTLEANVAGSSRSSIYWLHSITPSPHCIVAYWTSTHNAGFCRTVDRRLA